MDCERECRAYAEACVAATASSMRLPQPVKLHTGEIPRSTSTSAHELPPRAHESSESNLKSSAKSNVKSKTRSKRKQQRGPPPPVDEVIAAAVRASGDGADRGANPLDRRFRWHTMGKIDEARTAPRTAPTGLYRRLLGDGTLLRDAVMTVQARVAAIARGVASVVVGGSTGMRLEQAGKAHASALGDVSDVDVDVYVADDQAHRLAEVIAAVDRACVDVARDQAFSDACEERMPRNLTTQGRRFPARVYAASESAEETAGCIVAIDVPTLTHGAPRVHPGPVFATRNDTLTGMVLHRIRVALAAANTDDEEQEKPPWSVPIIDIKTRVGVAPPTVARRVAGLQVRVPTAKHAISELECLLNRTYSNVDPAKDAARHKQLAHLKAHLKAAPKR